MKKKILREMLTLFQNSNSDFIVPSGMTNGFMTDSESAHYAILETLHMLGLTDLVSVEETVEYGILHYRFHFNVEEDLEEIRAQKELEHPMEVRVFLDDNEIHSIYVYGNVNLEVTEYQLMPNDYDDDCGEYAAALQAVFSATQNDPAFSEQKVKHFDWESWEEQHPDLVAAQHDENE